MFVLPGSLLARASHAQGHDFIDEARLFYRVVTCGGDGALPAEVDAQVVNAHCKEQGQRVERFRKRYIEPATQFLARHRPANLPTSVVYPFGGGDLVSALITYPDATEITTISLEHAGDPRRLTMLGKKDLASSLALYREVVHGLLLRHDSASENLRKMEKGPIPGQLAFFIQGLVAMDYEPVSLRFFRIEDNGSLHYLTRAEIDELDGTRANKKSYRWVDTDYSVAFSNMELAFRRRGRAASEPVRIHRHIAANLDDQHFRGSPLERHLMSKDKIAAMTKAASYLLWMHSFTGIRNYLLEHMTFMVSDSTGVPPKFARKAGFSQKTFGAFTGSFLKTNELHNQAFVELWASQPKRRLPFRYGYPDAAGSYHLVLTFPNTKKQTAK